MHAHKRQAAPPSCGAACLFLLVFLVALCRCRRFPFPFCMPSPSTYSANDHQTTCCDFMYDTPVCLSNQLSDHPGKGRARTRCAFGFAFRCGRSPRFVRYVFCFFLCVAMSVFCRFLFPLQAPVFLCRFLCTGQDACFCERRRCLSSGCACVVSLSDSLPFSLVPKAVQEKNRGKRRSHALLSVCFSSPVRLLYQTGYGGSRSTYGVIHAPLVRGRYRAQAMPSPYDRQQRDTGARETATPFV